MQYCEKSKHCNNIKYSKLVTAGNDPNISKGMRYSQYISTTKGRYKRMIPIDYVSQTNLFIEQYILQNGANININLGNLNVFIQQYELKKNIINNITIQQYNSLITDLNDWVQEYKNNNGTNNLNLCVFVKHNTNPANGAIVNSKIIFVTRDVNNNVTKTEFKDVELASISMISEKIKQIYKPSMKMSEEDLIETYEINF
jgi:hypothetical protein